jgi:hypothetical protein
MRVKTPVAWMVDSPDTAMVPVYVLGSNETVAKMISLLLNLEPPARHGGW